MIVTISSQPGIEAKEICKSIALEFNLQYVSGEEIAMKIPEQKELIAYAAKLAESFKAAAKGNSCIVEHALAGLSLKEADAKIFLLGFKLNRARRLAKRLAIKPEEALEQIEAEEERLKNISSNGFGLDLYNLHSYDLALNLDKLDNPATIEIIKDYINKACA